MSEVQGTAETNVSAQLKRLEDAVARLERKLGEMTELIENRGNAARPPMQSGGFQRREGGYPRRDNGGYPPRREGGYRPEFRPGQNRPQSGGQDQGRPHRSGGQQGGYAGYRPNRGPHPGKFNKGNPSQHRPTHG